LLRKSEYIVYNSLPLLLSACFRQPIFNKKSPVRIRTKTSQVNPICIYSITQIFRFGHKDENYVLTTYFLLFNFSPEQIRSIEQSSSNIANKRTKTGLTWHHDTESEKIILVPWDLHDLFRHTGGNAIWAKQIVE
jgi:hypothetical protein